MLTDKTVREIADIIGVTKQTVQYHLKNLPKDYIKKSEKNIIYISPLGQKILIDKIDKKKQSSVDKEPAKETEVTAKEIEFFKKQIKEKDQQIDQLLKSQKQLQKLVENQQILTLQANQKIEQLEITLENTEIVNSNSTNSKRKWRGFFSSKNK